jgi:SAM-dependent methyltransferase
MIGSPTREQLEFHYRLERELAGRIRNAPRAERARVTLAAYDELFRKVPWHSGHLLSAEIRALNEAGYDAFLAMAGNDHDILEIGCGGSAHLRRLAPRNRRCVGIDISAEVLAGETELPPNVELYVADAVDLSRFKEDSFDFVFSKQLVEHIHPDDVAMHFCEVHRVLRREGVYVFETPSRITGPHDVSRYFDREATCLHLREYSFRTILPLLREAGFRDLRSPLFRERARRASALLGKLTEIPAAWKLPGEALTALLPTSRGRQWGSRLFRLNVFLIARK